MNDECFSTGTQKAKRYVKKALSFAVDSGYLIPNSKGTVLRVAPSLSGFTLLGRRAEPEARRRRRRMRRGEGALKKSERKELRQKGSPAKDRISPHSRKDPASSSAEKTKRRGKQETKKSKSSGSTGKT